MSSQFDWAEEVKFDWGIVHKPVASVKIQGKETSDWTRFLFKIDSGTTITVMNKGDCEQLGLNYEDGEKFSLRTALGSIPCRVHKVSMKIGDNIVNDVRIAFAEIPIAELLMGRLEIFEKFGVEFRGKICKTIFHPEN